VLLLRICYQLSASATTPFFFLFSLFYLLINCCLACSNFILDRVTCLSSDGKSLHFASGSHDKTVKVWGVKEDGGWAQLHSFSDHNGSVTCAEIRGNFVISGSYDNSLKVFDILSFYSASPLFTPHYFFYNEHICAAADAKARLSDTPED
jgi:WD40 repeat protein